MSIAIVTIVVADDTDAEIDAEVGVGVEMGVAVMVPLAPVLLLVVALMPLALGMRHESAIEDLQSWRRLSP